MPDGEEWILTLYVGILVGVRKKSNSGRAEGKMIQKEQTQEAGNQWGYDNSSPNERSRNWNMGRVYIDEKLDAYAKVIREGKQLLTMKTYLVWTRRRWCKGDIMILRVIILENGVTQEHILE